MPPSRAKKFKYCSNACYDRAASLNPNWQNYRPSDPKPRFWSKVKKTDSCWLWTGALNGRGYGIFGVTHGNNMTAHRFAWLMANGSIPDGMDVCHHCDVRCCVNPIHMFVGTRSDNMRDCAEKGRTANAFSALNR